jgi:hypothetical protein
MSRKLFAAIFIAVLGLAASPAHAWPKLECSPGFWKTHLLGPAAELCALGDPAAPEKFTCEDLVAILSQQGGGAIAEERHAAAECLNAVAEETLSAAVNENIFIECE